MPAGALGSALTMAVVAGPPANPNPPDSLLRAAHPRSPGPGPHLPSCLDDHDSLLSPASSPPNLVHSESSSHEL